MTRRSVLVTGGSRGIGAAIAREFAQAGDQIAIHYVSSQPVAEEVRKSLAGDGHITAQADLRDADAEKAKLVKMRIMAIKKRFTSLLYLSNPILPMFCPGIRFS